MGIFIPLKEFLSFIFGCLSNLDTKAITIISVSITAFSFIVAAFIKGIFDLLVKKYELDNEKKNPLTNEKMSTNIIIVSLQKKIESIDLDLSSLPAEHNGQIILDDAGVKKIRKSIGEVKSNLQNINSVLADLKSAGEWLYKNIDNVIEKSLELLKDSNKASWEKIRDNEDLGIIFKSILIYISKSLTKDDGTINFYHHYKVSLPKKDLEIKYSEYSFIKDLINSSIELIKDQKTNDSNKDILKEFLTLSIEEMP